MSRYISKSEQPEPARAWFDPWPIAHHLTHPSAIVSPPVDTGLLDAQGRKIMRVPDEIGFLPRREHP